MLHWKNKPIDLLTREELREALSASVERMLYQNDAEASWLQSSPAIPNAFVAGMFAGGVVVAVAFLLLS